jgi:SAM-dependent methyltransferase
VALPLSRALFGLDLKLPDFPLLKTVRGLGFSDSETYSEVLADRFSYTNTFYHRVPRFDLLQPDETEFGKYDFVICSDVLEHVPDPIDRAFGTLGGLLKPTGVLILTVPYSLEPGVIEHYPDLAGSTFAEIDGRTVLVCRSTSGEYRVFGRARFLACPQVVPLASAGKNLRRRSGPREVSFAQAPGARSGVAASDEVARAVDQRENVDLFWSDTVDDAIASHQELADFVPPEFRNGSLAM